MARSDPKIALRKIDIVNWRTAVVQQFNIHSIPQVTFMIRVVVSSAPSSASISKKSKATSRKQRRAAEQLRSDARTRTRAYEFNSEPNIDSKVYIVPSAAKMAMKIDRQIVSPAVTLTTKTRQIAAD